MPPALLVLTSGFIFQSIYHGSGFVIACMASLLGAAIGGTIAFSRASHMSHEMLDILVGRYPVLNVVDTAIVKSPLRIMMLLRLNPLIPFGVLNYVFAMKGLNVSPFIVAMASVMQWYLLLTCIGACFSNVYNGYAYAGYAIGAACGVVVMSVLWRFAKRELQKEVECHHLKEVLPVTVDHVKDEEMSTTSSSTFETKGSRIKRLASRLRLSKKKPKKTSETSSECSPPVAVSEPVDTSVVQNSDLSGGDYVRMQIFGKDHNSRVVSNSAHRMKLDASEVVLDNYS